MQEAARAVVRERAFDLANHLAGAVEAVTAVASLFEASGEVTRAEFQILAAPLLARHPCFAALEWAPRVPAADRERHELEARRAGLSGYRIWTPSGAGNTVPEAALGAYYPVAFVEPAAGNTSALGLDLGSEPTRAAALARAAQTGEPTLTDPISLVQGPEPTLARVSRRFASRGGRGSCQGGDSHGGDAEAYSQHVAGDADREGLPWQADRSPQQGDGEISGPGLLLVVPVHGTPVAGTSDHEHALEGFAAGVLRVDRLVEQSLPASWAANPTRILLELVAETADGRQLVLYSTPPADPGGLPPSDSWREPVELAGQHWALFGRPTPGFLAAHRTSRPAVLGLIAFLGFEVLLGAGFLAARHARSNELLRQADLIHSVLHSIGEGVVVADTSGRFLIANDAARRMLGSAPAGISPAEWPTAFGLFLPSTEALFPADQLPLARAIRGEEVADTEVFARNPQLPGGAWFSVSGTPLRDREGSLVGGVVVFRDVTSRRHADELALRFSSAVEQTADGVFITDQAGVIEYVNPAFEQITGFARHEAVGQTPRLLRSGRQGREYYAALWASITAGNPFKATVVNRKKSGELFVAEQTITPMKNGSCGKTSHFVSVLRDMTERVQLQEKEVEMRVAASVQQRLFPQEPPCVVGYDIAGVVSPALATCGDYFDFIPLPDGGLALAVADVCGHGVGSALIMAETRAFLRSLLRTRMQPGDILAQINENLHEDLDDGLFVTMFLAMLDSGSGTVRWASAGHPTSYVVDRRGAVKAALKSTGTILGSFPGRLFAEGEPVVLEPGDLLVLMTDGVVETAAPDGSELGETATVDSVRAHRQRTAREVVDHVLEQACSFRKGGPQEDDLTLVVCKREMGGPDSHS